MSTAAHISPVASIQQVVAQVCADYPVMRAYLFGSFARGEQNASSDIDLMIELLPDSFSDGLMVGSLYCDLEDALGTPIDLLTVRPVYLAATQPHLYSHIESEKVLLYEC